MVTVVQPPRFVGALWGKESVENPTFVGIVLHYLDSGVSYEALLDLALGLNALLGANKTNEASRSVCLYANLMGRSSPDSDAADKGACWLHGLRRLFTGWVCSSYCRP